MTDRTDAALTLRRGHYIQGLFFEFPHLCPGALGAGCAIGRYLEQKALRSDYESRDVFEEEPRGIAPV